MPARIFFLLVSIFQLPRWLQFEPRELLQSRNRDVFTNHYCGFLPKTCTVDRDEAGLDDCVWIDAYSPHAKSLKRRDPKKWQRAWLKVPNVPRFQPVVGQLNRGQGPVPESTSTLQKKQEQHV